MTPPPPGSHRRSLARSPRRPPPLQRPGHAESSLPGGPPAQRSNAVWLPALAVLLLGAVVVAVVTGELQIPALAAAAACVLIVARLLPPAGALTLVLVLYAVVPFDYLALPAPFPILSPIIVLAAALAIATGAPPPHWLRRTRLMAPIAFTVYALVIPVLRPQGQIETIVSWTAVVVIALIALPLWMSDPSVFRPLTTALLLVSVVLAIVGTVESTTRSNLYAEIFASAPFPLTQKWSVYRIMTTLGHPLVNGTFFASVGSLAFGLFLKGGRPGALLGFAACCAGVLLSGSRSAMVAIAVGVLVAGGVTVFRLTGSRLVRLIVAFAPLLVIVSTVGAQALDPRSETEEGARSADVRDLVLRIGLKVLPTESGVFGSGGGLSGVVFAQNGGGNYVLESSLWQTVFSYGLIGTTLLLAHLLIVLICSIARGAVAGPAMLVAYLVAASAFNLLESAPASLIIPALALLLTIAEARSEPAPPRALPPVPPRRVGPGERHSSSSGPAAPAARDGRAGAAGPATSRVVPAAPRQEPRRPRRTPQWRRASW
ncbi:MULTISPECIES: O-antigen ligase [unclassified Rathayibacter]|uniref:O-antigen ligase family protein n=1 Tax=unclassified Rathayibacter TaxID=2609250 RepID=UPI000FBFA943|nr:MULTISPECIES: O-antigen ligase family protein [unclassified Rathayibacter]ROP57746.1 hypothetical protein EDF45_1284 [Rathayibacter sp. PhB186]ROS56131.1 hypothetical protein EDF44_1284 [Rathayibacter sp. PhB185]